MTDFQYDLMIEWLAFYWTTL